MHLAWISLLFRTVSSNDLAKSNQATTILLPEYAMHIANIVCTCKQHKASTGSTESIRLGGLNVLKLVNLRSYPPTTTYNTFLRSWRMTLDVVGWDLLDDWKTLTWKTSEPMLPRDHTHRYIDGSISSPGQLADIVRQKGRQPHHVILKTSVNTPQDAWSDFCGKLRDYAPQPVSLKKGLMQHAYRTKFRQPILILQLNFYQGHKHHRLEHHRTFTSKLELSLQYKCVG